MSRNCERMQVSHISVKQYAANTIAQNMYSQVDEDGYSTALLESIVDYSKDGNAVSLENQYVTTRSLQLVGSSLYSIKIQVNNGYLLRF